MWKSVIPTIIFLAVAGAVVLTLTFISEIPKSSDTVTGSITSQMVPSVPSVKTETQKTGTTVTPTLKTAVPVAQPGEKETENGDD